MDPLSQLSRQDLEALTWVYARQCMAIDGYWFMKAEDRWGHEAAFDLDMKVWERLSAIEARRVARALKLKDSSMGEILRAFTYSPTWLTLGLQADLIDENQAVLTTTDCFVQKNRLEQGRVEFACKPIGQLTVAAFARALDPNIRVTCHFCPPDPHPPDGWCRWQLYRDSPSGQR